MNSGAPISPGYPPIDLDLYRRLSRPERQSIIRRHYDLIVYTAAQTLDFIELLNVWPVADENEWFCWVADVREQAEVDDLVDRQIRSKSPQVRATAPKAPSGYRFTSHVKAGLHRASEASFEKHGRSL